MRKQNLSTYVNINSKVKYAKVPRGSKTLVHMSISTVAKIGSGHMRK